MVLTWMGKTEEHFPDWKFLNRREKSGILHKTLGKSEKQRVRKDGNCQNCIVPFFKHITLKNTLKWENTAEFLIQKKLELYDILFITLLLVITFRLVSQDNNIVRLSFE